MASKKTWLITGASSGIGYGIALAALQAGHIVIATARKPSVASSNHPDFEKLGGQWARLDVSVPEAQQVIEEIVKGEEERQRKARGENKVHWVIVNNAGVMADGLVEDQSETMIDKDVQTVLYGAIRVWKGSIPTLRRHRAGTLITVGSIFGMAPFPETQLYSALKATVTNLTDSYASVLGPLGIRCIVMEPGLFRTSIANNSVLCDLPLTPEYAPRVNAWRALVNAWAKNPKLMQGDPGKLGQRVVEVVDDSGLGKGLLSSRSPKDAELLHNTDFPYETKGALRVILGPDALAKWKEKYDALGENWEAMQELAASTNHDDFNEGQSASRSGGAAGEKEDWEHRKSADVGESV